jgi:hypothetical protein
MRGKGCLQGWAGYIEHSCTIDSETPKKYRLRLDEGARLPGGRIAAAGESVLVPKHAVKLTEE